MRRRRRRRCKGFFNWHPERQFKVRNILLIKIEQRHIPDTPSRHNQVFHDDVTEVSVKLE